MQRQVCWTERLEGRTKREIRVKVHNPNLKWQFKISTCERWDYDTPPTPADWDALLERMENRYQRRNIPVEDLELVRRLRREAMVK